MHTAPQSLISFCDFRGEFANLELQIFQCSPLFDIYFLSLDFLIWEPLCEPCGVKSSIFPAKGVVWSSNMLEHRFDYGSSWLS